MASPGGTERHRSGVRPTGQKIYIMKKFAFFTPVVKSLNVELVRIKKSGVQQLYAGVAAGDQIRQMLNVWDANKATLKDNGVTNKREYLFNDTKKGTKGLTGLGKSQAYALKTVFENRDQIEPYIEQAANPSISDFLNTLSGGADKKDKPKVVTIQNTATGEKITIKVEDLTEAHIEALEAFGMIA